MIARYAVWVTMGHLRRIRRHSGKFSQPRGRPTGPGGPERIELEISELEAILERVRSSLSLDEYGKLQGALETLLFLTQELEKKRVSVQRLKQLLFGAATETTRKVMERILDEAGGESGYPLAGGNPMGDRRAKCRCDRTCLRGTGASGGPGPGASQR